MLSSSDERERCPLLPVVAVVGGSLGILYMGAATKD